MDFRGLLDPNTGRLENCPLRDLLAHELGHWIVLEEADIQPDGLGIYGICQESGSPVVTRGGGTPFGTSFSIRWDFALVYAAGAVGEQLYAVGAEAFDCNATAELLNDESCRHDLDELIKVLRTLKGDEVTRGTALTTAIGEAIRGARDVLLPRLPNLRREIDDLEKQVIAQELTCLELPWSADRATRLCGRERSWYEVD